MCSYITQIASISGQGSGPNGWFDLNQANVYFDHPFHAPLDHAVTVDFVNPTMGPSARVAIELSADSAERLMQLIDASILASTSGNYETPGAIEDQQSELLKKVQSIAGTDNLEIDLKVDSELIGGFVVNVGSKVIDASIAGQVRRLGLALAKVS